MGSFALSIRNGGLDTNIPIAESVLNSVLTYVAKKAQDQTVRFISVSVVLHFGLMLLAGATLDLELLGGGTAGLAVMGVWTLARHGPSIAERTGSVWSSIQSVIVVPLVLFATSVPVAVAVESVSYTPKIQAALFAVWQYLYIAATTLLLVRIRNNTTRWKRPLVTMALCAVPIVIIMFGLNMAMLS